VVSASALPLAGSGDVGRRITRPVSRGLPLNDVYYELTRSFSKRDFIGEAALKQHAYAVVTGHFSGGNQRSVLTDS
jgi:hypothetical protein